MYTERGKYYEEFMMGETLYSQARTVTEADIVNFCGFTGDWTQIHSNVEFAKTQNFGQRIAHGMLTMSMASGLLILSGTIEGTIIGFEGIKEWRFKRPVYIGDTVRAESEVIYKEERKLKGTDLGAGSVQLKVSVKNQKGKVCQDGIWSMLVKKKTPL